VSRNVSRRNSADLIRSARFGLARAIGRLAILRRGVTAAPDIDVIGLPIISVYPGSSIAFGRGVCLISSSFATALGVNHPVVLRTLCESAQIILGDAVGISGGTICAAERVEIGAGSMLGANVTIADTDFHSLAVGDRSVPGHEHASIGVAPVLVGTDVFIGTNSLILKGVRIGRNSVIGAGSVVTRDIPENCIAAGNPCRVIRQLSNAELAS